MTNYKTLKELKSDESIETLEEDAFDSGFNSLKRVAKKEAINWIKGFDKYPDCIEGVGMDKNLTADELLKRWIKHFFNITEEDLK